MLTSTITSKGQVTIPKEIRDYLQLHIGDHLQFMIDRKGKGKATYYVVKYN